MLQPETEDPSTKPKPALPPPEKKGISAFFSKKPLDGNQPALIHYTATPLFRLEKNPEKYAHLMKEKDFRNIGPIVNYFISNSGHTAFLAGDVVRNLYLHGRRKYKTINILAILSGNDVEKYSSIMNNIISSNDGAFSMGFKYRVRKNRSEGGFREIAKARYVIEPRLEGLEKLLFLFRPASIELELTTQNSFSDAFGVEVI